VGALGLFFSVGQPPPLQRKQGWGGFSYDGAREAGQTLCALTANGQPGEYRHVNCKTNSPSCGRNWLQTKRQVITP
jgi:hypothetical protein